MKKKKVFTVHRKLYFSVWLINIILFISAKFTNRNSFHFGLYCRNKITEAYVRQTMNDRVKIWRSANNASLMSKFKKGTLRWFRHVVRRKKDI